MSFTISRVAFAARVPIVARQAALVIPVRYNSSIAKKSLPVHPTSQVSISPTGSETPSDEATSSYTPVTSYPKDQPVDGPLAAATVSGAPVELQTRTVRIYRPSKAATQSSNWPGQRWKMDWDVLTRRGNWENPLMGWTSSADHMQGTHLWFKTKEDAIHFAEKQGYEYYVQEPNVRAFRPKQYAANFTHSPDPLKIIRTK